MKKGSGSFKGFERSSKSDIALANLSHSMKSLRTLLSEPNDGSEDVVAQNVINPNFRAMKAPTIPTMLPIVEPDRGASLDDIDRFNLVGAQPIGSSLDSEERDDAAQRRQAMIQSQHILHSSDSEEDDEGDEGSETHKDGSVEGVDDRPYDRQYVEKELEKVTFDLVVNNDFYHVPSDLEVELASVQELQARSSLLRGNSMRSNAASFRKPATSPMLKSSSARNATSPLLGTTTSPTVKSTTTSPSMKGSTTSPSSKSPPLVNNKQSSSISPMMTSPSIPSAKRIPSLASMSQGK